MPKFDLTAGSGTLRDAADSLMQAWDETKTHWNDSSSRNFEENHLRPLLRELGDGLNSIQRMGELLAQAERQCEPW